MTHKRDAEFFVNASLEERLFLYWDERHIDEVHLRNLTASIAPAVMAFIDKCSQMFQAPQLILQQESGISANGKFSTVRALLHELDSPVGSQIICAYMTTTAGNPEVTKCWVNGWREIVSPQTIDQSNSPIKTETIEEFIKAIEAIDLNILINEADRVPSDNAEIPRGTRREWEQEGCRVIAEVNPRSWLYPRHYLTLTISFYQADGTAGGHVTVVEPIPYSEARLMDFESLAAVSLVDCACTRYKAFNPELYGTSREGRCEECFLALASDW